MNSGGDVTGKIGRRHSTPIGRGAWSASSPFIQSILIFTAALVLRLCIAHGYPPVGVPEIVFYRGDAPAYYEYAAAIATGGVYDQGLPFHPPLLAWVAAPLFQLVGSANSGLHTAIAVLTAVIGGLVAVLAFWLGRWLAGPMVGLWSGVLVALHFGLATAATTLNTENLNAALELAALLVVLAAWRQAGSDRRHGSPGNTGQRSRTLWFYALAGALAGLAALTRAEDQLFVLLVAIAAAWAPARVQTRSRHSPAQDAPALTRGGGWLRGIAVLAGAALIIAPWTLRNSRVIDEFNRTRGHLLAEPLNRLAPITCYGGLNFALANHPDAAGGFDRSPLKTRPGNPFVDLGDPDHARLLNHGIALGLSYITQAPGRWLHLVARKLRIGSDVLRIGYGVRDRPAGLAGRRRAVDFMGPARWLLVLPHLAAIAAGMAVLRRQAGGAALALVHLPVLVKLVTLVLFFGYVRLLLVAMPVLLIDVAAALVAVSGVLWRRLAGRFLTVGTLPTSRPSSVAAMLLLALALLEGAILAHRGQEMRLVGPTIPGSTQVFPDADLEVWPDPR